jgi:lipopolysaccharide transport system ATP-binding protein
MGLSGRDMKRKHGEICEFAEIGEFIDEPVRTYSAGMGLRLGFAIAIATEPEVLLIDEVFAVGDMYFQRKCVERVMAFKRAGKTLLLCSHSLYDIRQLCDQALWLERGAPMACGDALHVTNDYATFQREHIETIDPGARRAGPRADLPRILRASVRHPESGEELVEVACGEAIEVAIDWENPDPERTPIALGVGFMRQDRTLCAAAATHLDGLVLEGASGRAILSVPELPLLAGTFTLLVVLFDGDGVHRYEEYCIPAELVVRARTRELGLFRMRHTWQLAPREAGLRRGSS